MILARLLLGLVLINIERKKICTKLTALSPKKILLDSCEQQNTLLMRRILLPALTIRVMMTHDDYDSNIIIPDKNIRLNLAE